MSTHDLTRERNWKPLRGIETVSFQESKLLTLKCISRDHSQTPSLIAYFGFERIAGFQ